MTTKRQRKSNLKSVDSSETKLYGEPSCIKQVPLHTSMCHGLEFNKGNTDDRATVSDSIVDEMKDLNLEGRFKPETLERNETRTRKLELGDSNVSYRNYVLPAMVGLELPKVELNYFDGQPTAYWMFIRQFETYVASRVIDDSQRLLYLIHYCKGKAKAAIEGCVIMDPTAGYNKAKEILKRLFGQPHIIARETLEGLFSDVNDYSDAERLANLAIKMENCEMVLKQMNYDADLSSLATLERIVKLLPRSLQVQWADLVDTLTENDREPTFSELTKFIASRARVAGSRFGQLAAHVKKRYDAKMNCYLQSEQYNSLAVKRKCSVCSKDHDLYRCPSFLSMTIEDRWSHARAKGVCFVCLKQGHRASECKSNKRNVEECSKRHHYLLHSNQHLDRPESSSSIASHCRYTKSLDNHVCLGMIPIRLRSEHAEVVGYALLDNGSDATLIRSDCLDSLGLKKEKASIVLQTVGGNKIAKVTNASFKVYSLDQAEHVEIEGALVVEKIPGRKPARYVMDDVQKWPHLVDVPLGSVDSDEVLLLIGCDVPEAHWVLDKRLGGKKRPYAIKTLLGWVVFGPTSYRELGKRVVNHVCMGQSSEDHLRRIYDMEFSDVYSGDKTVSIDDLKAMKIVEDGTYFSDGHFFVPTPWKNKIDRYRTDNYEMVKRRLQSLRRRLVGDCCFHDKYTRSVENNFTKGYAEKVSEIQRKVGYCPRWYLPHHAVINPRKLEKLRVVFDCAAKFAGVSSNDMIYQGPDTTAELVCILLRFRKEAIAISADVEEMFMQVKVPESDRGALRFLWWPNGDTSREPVEFQMTSHPFGATSSPFCANFAMNKTAQRFSAGYDDFVVDAVKNNFYVDDCLVSFPTCEQAKKFVVQMNELLCKGGFKLKKWITNSEAVKLVFPFVCDEEPSVDLPILQNVTHRTLGLEWDPRQDVFKFCFDAPKKPITRRGVLSVVSSLFDPLGLIAPTCLTAKLLLQRLCKAQIGWDRPLSEPDVSAWLKWVNFMLQVGHVTVPRGIKRIIDEPDAKVELHLFSDASELGYGAVAYARVKYSQQSPYCVLLYSKSRVAPIKRITIPRLEMAAAVLSVRMSEVLKKSFPRFFSEVNFYTDSMVVLYYIKNTESRYSTFIANRLAVIHQFTSVEQWRYIRSSQNPGDWTSRGIQKVSDLKSWFDCPVLLDTNVSRMATRCPEPTLENIEFRKPLVNVGLSSVERRSSPILFYFSEWMKLVRAVAWLRRFIEFVEVLSSSNVGRSVHLGHLKVNELEMAKRKVLMMVQEEVYGELISEIKSSGKLMKHNDLKKLSPIMLDGLLCVGGRLNYSDFPSTFSSVGVDYFGPLIVKRGRSFEKRYGCMFTCLQTRAVHIEMAHSLNTDSFVMSLLRFMGRRGRPTEIYSDNGSNFIGTVSELKGFIQQWDQRRISNELATKQIQWHFNPPLSSHRGEVWERMIRSVRRLLLLITKEQTLTDKSLATYLVEAEKILNNRPLTPVTQDAEDKLALSPNDLLLLRECDGVVEEGTITDKYSKRWRQVNYLANVFWKRWLKEYLPSLQSRQKWLVEHRNFKEGDVVIVTSDISARGKWPLGVVESCEIDNDGKVRTVTIRNGNGIVRRDIRKVCLLEGSE
ncbi:hypothetical protein MN116_000200 [Schistosoma mekongi]|uniref:Gag-Pol polyprotein n=1 Tax=Schistosoma mekongi TaxID=38744 RepID=A0AAE1ZHI3_SCHME|nr:hypothetical protein MN116_000200 [Schistosoma mekongi]